MIHILTHLVGDALAGEVKGDGGARPDLRRQRTSAGGELRSYSVFGAVVRLQYFFFLEIGVYYRPVFHRRSGEKEEYP